MVSFVRGLLVGSWCLAWCLAAGMLAAQPAEIPTFPRTPPAEPAAAARTFRVLHRFEMQLIAAEPLVADPVDVAYDEDGRAYVAEMRDYPYPEEKGAAPTEFLGQIRLLTDDNGDGRFDRGHVFASGLSWPTSVACWQGGVFVAAAPDIWYFRDTDGDYRADVRQKIYTGFSRDNVQAIVNGLRWGLDNYLYGAASGNGGRVMALPASGRDPTGDTPVVVTRHDFRFDPAHNWFEAIEGGARFGNSFDDWGNRFVCNIRNPVQHVLLPQRYVTRNRLLAAPSPIHDVAESGDQLPVYRISPPEAWRVFRAQRWTAERVNFPRSELVGAGYWTSSSGVTVYRGDAYPAAFQGNVFVGEVAGNLVHRQVLEPDGVTFVSRRADPEAEFVASHDIWFRPVNFVNAPDGTLHIVDMYRETIEHPWSIPDDIKARLDLRSGNDRGRIYRLAPPGFRVPPPPRLSQLDAAGLVAVLEHPGGWWRETAQRLLVERQDPAALPALRRLLASSRSPQAKVHALYTLAGLGGLTSAELHAGLHDPAPPVRRHAVRLAEPRLHEDERLRERLLQLADDGEATVRYQVAFSLGELRDPRAAGMLARMAWRDAEDPWIRTAVLSSCAADPLSVLRAFVQAANAEPTREAGADVVRELGLYVAAAGGAEPAREAAMLLNQLPAAGSGLGFALVSGLGAGLAQRNLNLSTLTSGESEWAVLARLWLDRARTVATDGQAPLARRLPALDLLRFLPAQEAVATFPPLLQAREPQPVQLAAVRVLKALALAEVAGLLVQHWKYCSPAARQEVVEALLSRPAWNETLLAALETEQITAAQLTIPQRGRLVNHTDAALRERAVRLLGPAATTARSEVVSRYQPALSLSPRPGEGEQVYRRECLTCHKLGSLGFDVGPNLNTVRHRSPAEILTHVLDPNREVAPAFVSYSVQLRDGRVLAGLIRHETDSGIELQRGDNVREVVARRDIEEIVSTGKSLMPEGVEQKISLQEMADLIAFLLAEPPLTPAPAPPAAK